MTCYKPFVGIKIGDFGKVKVFPHGYEPDDLPFPYKKIPIPCGHCIGCRLDKSRIWADRLMCELNDHDKACFLTLTYSPECLPDKLNYVNEDGEVLPSPRHPLVKKHVQDFMKRLRDRVYPKKLRYYAVGEYGEENNRPHYHIILFGYDFSDDRTFKFLDDNKHPHYVSSMLYDHKPADLSESVWKYGLCDIAQVSWSSCAYVARYVTKKLYGDLAEYEKYNYPPEFSLMSRRPGIGQKFIQDNLDKYIVDDLIITTENGPIEIGCNKYFDNILLSESPDIYKKLKLERAERSKNYQLARKEQSELTYLEQLAVDEKKKIKQCSVLKRSKV